MWLLVQHWICRTIRTGVMGGALRARQASLLITTISTWVQEVL